MYRADAEALPSPCTRAPYRASAEEVYRADDKTLMRQAADDTVVLKSILPCHIKYPVVLMLKKYPVMLQKHSVMLRAVAASSEKTLRSLANRQLPIHRQCFDPVTECVRPRRTERGKSARNITKRAYLTTKTSPSYGRR